jgi:glycopeptide antibiotics resistance protein
MFIEISVLYTKGFIRHTLGDFLVVIALYCLLMSIIKTSVKKAAITVLVFSFGIEFIQLTSFLTYFHLEKSTIAKTIFGNTFSIQNLIAYTLGIGLVLLVEIKRN